MKNFRAYRLFVFFVIFAAPILQTAAQATAPASTGKAPIIIIPGLTGSDLVNSKTGEEVWFKSRRAKDDDLRLPISPNLARNRDNLVTKDIIRSVQFFKFLPETEIYERLIDSLEKRGGYKEGKWLAPPKDGYQDTFYVFPYDWRRDNVENARLLVRQIEALKRKLGKPDLKFNVVAHSMGGLIARYAAMYGNADLPAPGANPTWAGSKHLDRIFLVGTPNEGSVTALNALLNGFSYVGGGLNLPFIQNINRFDVFTIPAIFQLLPHNGSFLSYDESLKPLQIDLYSPKTWEAYGWSIWLDDNFTKKMSPVEQRNARAYFNAVLARAKRFHAALDANRSEKIPVSFYIMGADCKDTLNGVVLVRDDKKNRWRTLFEANSYTSASGEKVTSEQLKPLIYSVGDSVVTKRSLTMESAAAAGTKNVLPISGEIFQCEGHNKLLTNPDIQDQLLKLLQNAPVN